MALKNDGKLAQKEFEDYWIGKGKAGYFHRITDASEVAGMNRRRGPVNVKKQPADYVLAHAGFSGYAEVKSTTSPRGFAFSIIEPHQLGHAERCIKAGGQYDFFVRRIGGDDAWYRVPASVVLTHPAQSMTWADLEPYRAPLHG